MDNNIEMPVELKEQVVVALKSISSGGRSDVAFFLLGKKKDRTFDRDQDIASYIAERKFDGESLQVIYQDIKENGVPDVADSKLSARSLRGIWSKYKRLYSKEISGNNPPL